MLDDTPNGVDLDWDNDGEDEMAYDQFMINFCVERQVEHPHECVCGYHDYEEDEVVQVKLVALTDAEKAEIDRRLKARRDGN